MIEVKNLHYRPLKITSYMAFKIIIKTINNLIHKLNRFDIW